MYSIAKNSAAPVNFDVGELAANLSAASAAISFAFVLGSARQGILEPESDIDIALYLTEQPTLSILDIVMKATNTVLPEVACDIGILNNADPVYRFEALKGVLLFARDPDLYHDFFSRTCRQYEFQMAEYQRQHQYRLEVINAC